MVAGGFYLYLHMRAFFSSWPPIRLFSLSLMFLLLLCVARYDMRLVRDHGLDFALIFCENQQRQR